MKLFSKLQAWWQVNTGQEETPFDRESTAFLASVVVHCFLLVSLGLWPMIFEEEKLDLTMTEVERVEELKVNEEVYFDDQPTIDIGAVSLADTEMATSQAPEISEVSAIPNPVEITTDVVSEIPVNQQVEIATGLKFSELLPVKGYVGESTRGATGAIDRITHEILLSMQERRTLVVWFFDQSASLMRERQAIHDRFDRVYEELGVLQASGNPAFRQQASKPLLTAMVAFGRQVSFLQGGEGHAFTFTIGQFDRYVKTSHDRILRGAHDRLAIGRGKDVIGGHHQGMGFHLGLDGEGEVNGHLIAVEVSIESLAGQRVQVNGITFHQDRFKGLDSHAMQRWSTIEQYRVIANHLFQDIPDFLVLAFEHFLGALDRIGVSELFQPPNNKGLEQLEGDFLG